MLLTRDTFEETKGLLMRAVNRTGLLVGDKTGRASGLPRRPWSIASCVLAGLSVAVIGLIPLQGDVTVALLLIGVGSPTLAAMGALTGAIGLARREGRFAALGLGVSLLVVSSIWYMTSRNLIFTLK